MARLRSLLSAALTLALTVGVAGLLGLGAAPAQADDTTTFLAVGAAGQTLNDPAVLTTAAGSGLAVWTQQTTVGGSVVKTPQLRRQVGTGAWTPVALDLGGLDNVGEPFLVQDSATGRVWLTASASRNGALDSTLGTYLWWSGDDGATFSAPVKVWSGFGIGDAAPFGDGGFWTTTGQAGATIGYVSSAYAPVTTPAQLTDRVGSRGAMALTTGGPGLTTLLAFQAGETGIWARSGAGAAGDLQVFASGDGLHVGVAGIVSGVLVAAIRPEAGRKVLYSRVVSTYDSAVGPEQRISPADAVFFEARASFDRQSAMAVWNDAAGDVHTSRTASAAGAWGSPIEVLSGSASGVSYISKPDVSSTWVTGLGNRAGDSAPVVWITRNAAITQKPSLSGKKATYSAGKRAIRLGLTASAPGKAEVTVLVAGATKKPLRQRFSFKVTSAGKLTQKLKVSKKLAAQLGAHPKARITVQLTLKNVAGKDSVRLRVRRR